jgi:hypothetical protein
MALTRQTGVGTFDSVRIVLQFINRDGSLRWRHTPPPQELREEVTGILEAPVNGFFLVGTEYRPTMAGPQIYHDMVIRLDSTGRELWRRRYLQRPNMGLANPTYTARGTFVCTTSYTTPAEYGVAIWEFNQRGDSLHTQRLSIEPQQSSRLTLANTNALAPLRDGGFILAGEVDSANTSYFRPFLARLDPQGNQLWNYIFRRQPLVGYRFEQPRELSDGSLVVVARNYRSGRNNPFWLFRFNASGQLTNTYPFVSQVLPPNNPSGNYGYFGRVVGLEALSDSTLVLAADFNDASSSHTYLAHLRVPGLPRLLDNHFVPAADLLATRPPLAATNWPGRPAYPNPTATTLTLPYRRPPGTRTLALRVSDALGRTVLTQPLAPTEDVAELDVRPWSPGLYLLTLEADGRPLARQRVAVAR